MHKKYNLNIYVITRRMNKNGVKDKPMKIKTWKLKNMFWLVVFKESSIFPISELKKLSNTYFEESDPCNAGYYKETPKEAVLMARSYINA